MRGKTIIFWPINFSVMLKKKKNHNSFVSPNEKVDILPHTGVFNQQKSHFISIPRYGMTSHQLFSSHAG